MVSPWRTVTLVFTLRVRKPGTVDEPPSDTATDWSTSEASASISVWMLPLRSAVGRSFRMMPYCLYSTVNWLLVISGIGTSPPARNSAFSPLAHTSLGCASSRP